MNKKLKIGLIVIVCLTTIQLIAIAIIEPSIFGINVGKNKIEKSDGVSKIEKIYGYGERVSYGNNVNYGYLEKILYCNNNYKYEEKVLCEDGETKYYLTNNIKIVDEQKPFSFFSLLKPEKINDENIKITKNGAGEYYKIGTVYIGDISNGKIDVYMAFLLPKIEGEHNERGYNECYYYKKYYFVNYDNKITIIAKDSDNLFYTIENIDFNKTYIDNKTSLFGVEFSNYEMELPNYISYGNANFYESGDTICSNLFFDLMFEDESEYKKISFNDIGSRKNIEGTIEDQTFYAKNVDGTIKVYDLNIELTNLGTKINWKDGKNGLVYDYHYLNGGSDTKPEYSIGSFLDVIEHYNYDGANNFSIKDLEITGTTLYGDIYEFKDKNNVIFKDLYERLLLPSYEDKIKYEDFVKTHPMFFWKNSLGDLMIFLDDNIDMNF